MKEAQNYEIGDFTYKRESSRKHIIIAFILTLLLGIGGGILIGYFAIPREDDRSGVFLDGVHEKIIQDGEQEISGMIIDGINADNIRTYLGNLTLNPHVAGTPEDLRQAQQLKDFWIDAGLDEAFITPYDVLLSYPHPQGPNKIRIWLRSDILYESPDRERPLKIDEILPPSEQLSSFLAYSGNGYVQGQPIYVNYARREDFDHLVSINKPVTNLIAIARYGKIPVARKVKYAQEYGALGVILYADPGDFNPVNQTEFYPDSRWQPGTAAPYGSAFDGIGDPLTPGYPSVDSSFRYPETEAQPRLPSIPAMPVGFDGAWIILSSMVGRQWDGIPAPTEWQGGMNFTYWIAPGFLDNSWVLDLNVTTRNQIGTTYNALGIIRGLIEPDRYVLLGNHRDSWVRGATDPSGGTAVMMELSRVMGDLIRSGQWRPRRSIIFCSWGAGEFSMLGSTEWTEEYIKNLNHRAIAYINMDIAVTGNFSLRGIGSPPLYRAMAEAAKRVPNPDPMELDAGRLSVYDTWMERRPWINSSSNEEYGMPEINPVGTDSDYVSFQRFAGIPCADYRYDYDFKGNNLTSYPLYPLYHTAYDTYYAVETFVDPGFNLHRVIGQVNGELLRYLADSLILPFNLTDQAWMIEQYTDYLYEVFNLTMAANDIWFGNLTDALNIFKGETVTFHNTIENLNVNNPMATRLINDQMMQMERAFLDPAGIPNRPLSRHVINSASEYDHFKMEGFPGLLDGLYALDRSPTNSTIKQIVQQHFAAVVFSIQSASSTLKDVVRFIRT